MSRSGMGTSSLAVVGSVALATGFMLLSFSGGLFSIPGQTLEGGGLEPGIMETDALQDVDATEYIDSDAASRAAESGILRKIARGIFQFLSGQDLSPPDGLSANGSFNGEARNMTVRNGTGDVSNMTGDPDQRQDAGNRSGNVIETGNASEDGGGPNEGDGQRGNETADGENVGGEDTGEGTGVAQEEMNDSVQKGNASSSGGFLSDMVKQVSEVISGGEGSENDGAGSQQEGRYQQQDDGGDGSGMFRGVDSSQWVLMFLALVGLIGGGFVIYRSDRSWLELLKVLAERAGAFCRSLPDLLGRLIVKFFATGISMVGAVVRAVRKVSQSPREAVRQVLAVLSRWIGDIWDWFETIRKRSFWENVDVIVNGGGEDVEGVERLWIRLKEAVDEETRSKTPVEIGRLAVEEGFPPDEITEIVAALRRQKYSSRGRKRVDVGRLEQGLWGDQDVEGV